MYTGRRPGSSTPPASAIAYQPTPCSPARARAMSADSTACEWPRVRRTRSNRKSKLEADPVLLGVPPHVDHLGEVHHDLRVLGLEPVPAPASVALERAHERVVGLPAGPQGQHLAALEAHVDPHRFLACHQCPSTGSTSSVSAPPVNLGCTSPPRLPRMPVRRSASIRRRPAGRTESSAESM